MSHIYLKTSGQGTPLVLLHGFGFDHQIFNPIVPLLENKYRVIQVDLPGFGQTPLMPFNAFAEQLIAELKKPAAMLGWSLGGLIATRLVLEQASAFSHLINVTSSPHFIADTAWPGIAAETLNRFSDQLRHNPQKTHQDFVALQVPQKSEYPIVLPDKLTQEGLAKIGRAHV